MIRHFLFSSCWFRHDRIRARNMKQELVLKCVECGDEVPVLASEVIQGPKARPDRVPGEPKTQTFTESKVRRLAAQASRRA